MTLKELKEAKVVVDGYEMALRFWKQKNMQGPAALSVALGGKLISFAYHSGKIENHRLSGRS